MKFSIKDFFSKSDQIRRKLFGQIYCRNPKWKTSFFAQCHLKFKRNMKTKNNLLSNISFKQCLLLSNLFCLMKHHNCKQQLRDGVLILSKFRNSYFHGTPFSRCFCITSIFYFMIKKCILFWFFYDDVRLR